MDSCVPFIVSCHQNKPMIMMIQYETSIFVNTYDVHMLFVTLLFSIRSNDSFSIAPEQNCDERVCVNLIVVLNLINLLILFVNLFCVFNIFQ